jgi:chaperonin GroES
MATGVVDDTTPYHIIEQHTFYDFDKDGYAEPCIVTFERITGKILRIAARYHKKDIVMKPDGSGTGRITPIQMYTKFGFVPNPDGSFYDIGFGVLLGPLNESVNTLINQLVDAGTISSLQSGFIGKSLRLKMGDARITPGEWRPVNATGDDLRKQIVPLPAKDPSSTLFQLMGSLITSGKELASVAEIFTGKMPGQNTPATTTMASIEQGMKVFTAVYKRIFRSLAEEFDKIFDLNFMYLDPQTYINVLDIQVDPSDFDRSSCDITPGADPTAISQTEKLLKAQGLMELLQAGQGILDPIEVFRRILDAQEQPNYEKLFSQQVQQTGQMPPPPPDPKILALQAKSEAEQKKIAMTLQQQQQQQELESRSKEQQMMQSQQEHQQEMQARAAEADQKARIEMAQGKVKIAVAAATGQQQVVHAQQAHQQQLQHAKETSKLQQSQPKKK